VFNLSGSEIVFILLAGLVVLGPEKLPGAIRQAGRIYSEIRRMGQGFQSELRATLDEPMRELRETADLAKKSVSTFTQPLGEDGPDLTKVTPRSISSGVQRALDEAATAHPEPESPPEPEPDPQ
jgi:sec-independent protein translocase protein TatB